MKNSIKKLASLLLVLVMMASVLAGCSGNKKGDSSDGNTDPTGDKAERPKVTILTNINVDTEGTDVNDNDYIKYVEEQTGIDIEFINDTSSDYSQKLNTVMASGNLPDAVMLMGDTQRTDLATLHIRRGYC